VIKQGNQGHQPEDSRPNVSDWLKEQAARSSNDQLLQTIVIVADNGLQTGRLLAATAAAATPNSSNNTAAVLGAAVRDKRVK
jgi:hypothetical protein